MLFDLQARGRRRVIKVIYLSLAILMGGGLVFFGIGGNVSGGLFDAFREDGGGTDNSALERNVERAEERVQRNPRDAAGWAALARARYQLAGIGDNFNQETGQFTEGGKARLREVERAWDRYLALDPKEPDDEVATLMAQAFAPTGLNKPEKAVTAWEIVVEARPRSSGLYAQLAVAAYQAGQTRKGDLASGRAVELASEDQKELLKQQLEQAKQQATGAAAGGQGQPPADTAGSG
jgi:hypothetical protein